MLKVFNKKILALLMSSTLIVSCSTSINNISTPNTINDKKSFGIKNQTNIAQNTDLSYNGDWSLNGNRHQSSGTIDNTNSSINYTGNWSSSNNNSSTSGNYTFTNNSNIDNSATHIDNTNPSIVYTGNWLTYSKFKYSDPTASKYIVTNKETDINKLKYKYYPFQSDMAWSGSMQYWNTYSNGGFNYTYSDYAGAKVEIPFSGTNITLFQYKAPNRGICNVKIYDENFNIVRDLDIDNYDATSHISKTFINGLKNGNYKLIIQRKGTKNPSSTGYIYDFAKAEVYPSIEYKFNGTNINYNTFTANNSGKVAITIDNDSSSTQIVDLYNSGNIYQNIYTKNGLTDGEHTITIDSIQERNLSSSGYRMSIYEFNQGSSVNENFDVSGEFSGKFLNLKLIGTPNSGKADLFIDNVLNRELDMYSPSSSYYSVNINGLSDGNHTFKLVYKNAKNNSSTGKRINFDGYTTNKASLTFNGVGVKYFANKYPNQGKVDVWLDGSKYGTYDLYSSQIEEGKEIVNISGLDNGLHTIDLIPAGTKFSASSNYNINVDYLEIDDAGEIAGNDRIVWTASNDLSVYNVYSSTYNGSSWSVPNKISNTSMDLYPVLSLDGNRVVWYGKGSDNGSVNKIYSSDYNGSSWQIPSMISDASMDSYLPQVSADGNRLLWSARDLSQNLFTLYVSDYNGTWSSPIKISNNSTSVSPILSSMSLAGNAVVWTSFDGANYTVYASTYNGSSWSTPAQLFASAKSAYNISVNAYGNRVVWTGFDGSTYKIYISNYNGTSWSLPVVLSTNSTNNDSSQITASGNTIIWYGKDNTSYKIYVSKYNGSSWSMPVAISTTTTNNHDPSISQGGNRAIWMADNNNDNNFKVYVSDYNTQTSSWSAPVSISASTLVNPSMNVDLSLSGNTALWVTTNNDNNHNFYVSNYNGSSWSTPTLLSPITTNWYPNLN